MSYSRNYKKQMGAFIKAVDKIGNWLYNNPPPNVDPEAVDVFLDSLQAIGDSVLQLTKLYLIGQIGEEDSE